MDGRTVPVQKPFIDMLAEHVSRYADNARTVKLSGSPRIAGRTQRGPIHPRDARRTPAARGLGWAAARMADVAAHRGVASVDADRALFDVQTAAVGSA